jgi:hypothetical protein
MPASDARRRHTTMKFNGIFAPLCFVVALGDETKPPQAKPHSPWRDNSVKPAAPSVAPNEASHKEAGAGERHMFKLNLTAVATAAIIAVGLVAASDLAMSRTEPTAAATVAARFPAPAEMLIALQANPPVQTGSQNDRVLVPSAACVREHWPYLADECLSTPEGGTVKRPNRTITIERRMVAEPAQPMRVSEAIVR